MIIDIFEVQNEKVVLSPNCLLIPEFKAIVEKYPDDHIDALSFLRFMYKLDSPYNDISEEDKEEIILKDVGGTFSLEDDVMIKGAEKAQKLWTTPKRRFYLDAKVGLEKMGKFMRDEKIKSGIKDGNDNTFLQMLKSMGAINKSFDEVERSYRNEIEGLARGGKDISYDE